MYRVFIKRFMACLLVCALTVGMFSSTAYASTSKTFSGTVSGVTVSGTLVMGDSYATLNTHFSPSGATRMVQASVYYSLNGKFYLTYKSASTTNAGGLSVKANMLITTAAVCGAAGYSTTEYNGSSYNKALTLGTIPSSPTVINE